MKYFILFTSILLLCSCESQKKTKSESPGTTYDPNALRLSDISGLYRFKGKGRSAMEIYVESIEYPENRQDSVNYELVMEKTFYEMGLNAKVFDSLIYLYNKEQIIVDSLSIDSIAGQSFFYRINQEINLVKGESTDEKIQLYGIKQYDSPIILHRLN
jgi:hypothetical protein